MGFFSSNFQPDYRDTFLFNGYIEYRATGNFKGDLLELIKTNDNTDKLFFNSNLTKQQYIDSHKKFDLVRNKDGKDFSTFEIAMPEGVFLPTGRLFENDTTSEVVWEFMLKNNPQKILFLKLPLNDNFITGNSCINMQLH